MITKLMKRLFSAQEKEEDELLTQFQDDLEIAKDNKTLDADEYSMYASDSGEVVVHDKVNDEDTLITDEGDGIQMKPLPKDSITVSWKDADGTLQYGTLVSQNDQVAVVRNGDGVLQKIDSALLIKADNQEFTDVIPDMIANIGGHDCQFNLDKGLVQIPEEKIVLKFDPKQSFSKVMDVIKLRLSKTKSKSKTFSQLR